MGVRAHFEGLADLEAAAGSGWRRWVGEARKEVGIHSKRDFRRARGQKGCPSLRHVTFEMLVQ